MEPADRFGKYALVRKLGHGAMKDVWLARDTVQDRDVALKFPTLEHLAQSIQAQLYSPDVKVRTLEEIRLQTKIGHHANLAEIYEANFVGEQLYLAEEYVAGRTLKEVAEIPWSRDKLKTLRTAARGAFKGLAHLRKLGKTHGDLRLENILVAENNQTKIIDFGLAGNVGEASTLFGSVLYRAPEVINERKMVPASDMWQMGVALYYAVTKTFPFDLNIPDWNALSRREKESARNALKERILNEPFISVQKKNKDVPAYFRDVIHSCLNKNPERRMTPLEAYVRLTPVLGLWKETAIALFLGALAVPSIYLGMHHKATENDEGNTIIVTSLETGKPKTLQIDASLSVPYERLNGATQLCANNARSSFAYITRQNEKEQLNIYGNNKPLLEAQQLEKPIWAPDDKSLAIIVRDDTDINLNILDLEGKILAKQHFGFVKELRWHPSGNYLTSLTQNGRLLFINREKQRFADEYPQEILTHAWLADRLIIARRNPNKEYSPALITQHKGTQNTLEKHIFEITDEYATGEVSRIEALRNGNGFIKLENGWLTIMERGKKTKRISLNTSAFDPRKGVTAFVEGKDSDEIFYLGIRDDADGSGFLDEKDARLFRERFGTEQSQLYYSKMHALKEIIYLKR